MFRKRSAAVHETAETGALLGRIQSVQYIGGHGLPLTRGAKYDCLFFERLVEFARVGSRDVTVPYTELTRIETSGPGEMIEGGGVVGGGFGPDAVEGMLIAGLVNAVTPRRIETVLSLHGPSLEAFVLTDAATPEQLAIELSPIRARLTAPAPEPQAEPSEGSVSSEIERLADLRERGLLTEEEFSAAKRKLLEQ